MWTRVRKLLVLNRIERLHSTINTLCMQYLTYIDYIHLQYTFQFNNYWVLIAYQVTVHNKCSKCPPPESVHTWRHAYHGLSHTFTGLRAVVNSLTCIKKWVVELSLHFQLEFSTLAFLSATTDKIPNDWFNTVGTRKLRVYGHELLWTFFLFECGWNALLYFFQAFLLGLPPIHTCLLVVCTAYTDTCSM
jgi:hypothetical protein